MSAPRRTTLPNVDLLSDLGFQPCRDEKCDIEPLHSAHESHNGKRSVNYRACPHCRGDLVRQPRKKAFCANEKCGWRGNKSSISTSRSPKHSKQEHTHA